MLQINVVKSGISNMKQFVLSLLGFKKTPVQAISNENYLNDGLYLAMEFGNNWLKPIQERLKIIHPYLSDLDLDILNVKCQKCMSFGHNLIYKLAEENGKMLSKEQAIEMIKDKYPWINARNMDRLISQGIYYAFKDGVF